MIIAGPGVQPSNFFSNVGWVSVKVLEANWNGSRNASVRLQKSYRFDQKLLAVNSLSDTGNVFEGAFSTATLIEQPIQVVFDG